MTIRITPPEPDPENTFLLNPDYVIVSGARHNQVSGRTHHVLALVSIALSIVCGYYALNRWIAETERSARLNQSAVPARAQVTGKRFEDTGRTIPDRYFLRYQFAVESTTVEREIEVDNLTYNRLQPGVEVAIKYLPDSPTVSTLADLDIAPAETDFILLVAIGPAVLALVTTLWALVVTWRNMRFARRGRMIAGEVISAKAVEINGHWVVTINYQFPTPDGGKMKAQAVRERDQMRTFPPPKEGDPVAVLYVNDRLFRLL